MLAGILCITGSIVLSIPTQPASLGPIDPAAVGYLGVVLVIIGFMFHQLQE